MTTRRRFVRDAAFCCASIWASPWPHSWSARPTTRDASLLADLAAIERDVGGRLGVFVLDAATGESLAHRADERFPQASTFKWFLAAQVLHRVDRGEESLARRISFSEADLVEYAPVTRRALGEGNATGEMTVETLLAATVTVSDNTAANLLLTAIGGPRSLTAYARALGDQVTRLDRIEPLLNEARPGDPRDTTTSRGCSPPVRRPRDRCPTAVRCSSPPISRRRRRSRPVGTQRSPTSDAASRAGERRRRRRNSSRYLGARA